MTAPPSDPSAAALVEQFAEEMVRRWRAGDRPLAEEYLDRHPDFWHRPAAALELIAEELALRGEYGQPATPTELAGRFPDWEPQVRALVDCQLALGPASPRFPEPGDAVGEFELRSQLGRGAHGRVYLAVQPALADRPVVLKLSPIGSGEHLSLARLQHSHIVPLFSAHEFPDRGLLGLCLPYFGGATLAQMLATGIRRGADLLAFASGDHEPARGPAWHFLDRATLPEAVAWVGACLADGLQYAHDRDLLHLDIKPSNVLIAGDGTPMLLDFHLSHPALRAGDPAPAWLGGTPGYMAPEQAAAFPVVRAGGKLTAPIDGRADVYSLGVVLSELLLKGSAGPAPVGLADVLARCTSADPQTRYATAGDVAADLRRHLGDLPLKGVKNRSLPERWGKWRRRRPHVLPLALTLVALLAIGGSFLMNARRQVAQAETAWSKGVLDLEGRRYDDAAADFQDGETLLERVPFQGGLRDRLRRGRLDAERGRLAADLTALCEHVRPLYSADALTRGDARAAAAQCRKVWDERSSISDRLSKVPGGWQADLLDVGILTAYLEARATRTSDGHRQALETLAEAEALFGPSGVLFLERAAHLRALGQTAAADEALRRGRSMGGSGSWEHLAIGRAFLAAEDYPRADAAFDRALALDPRSVWAHYARGLCHLRQARPTEAVAAFSACAALAPESAWCLYNRGLAYAAADRPNAAKADFDRATGLEPGLGAAYVGRSEVHAKAARYPEALDDLQRALDAGVTAADVEYRRAVIYVTTKELAKAGRSLRACLAADPRHGPAKELLAKLGGS
ncbi:MAG TPA: serine/threonine-protein kinase [Gemmataceae bacterium]|jgi:tetratricopeptide (TPR) repeat protein|nr:serine/threonine-protein kinase [Gemmataceae bacterium]